MTSGAKAIKIFVFGSNLAGRHGAGAAKFALRRRGAIYGQGEGLQGSSYGIPTKDFKIQTLPLETISKHVADFLRFATLRSDLQFELTPIGCGLAGYSPSQIASMFERCPSNVTLPPEFLTVLQPNTEDS